jgi:hypothetical protein
MSTIFVYQLPLECHRPMGLGLLAIPEDKVQIARNVVNHFFQASRNEYERTNKTKAAN